MCIKHLARMLEDRIHPMHMEEGFKASISISCSNVEVEGNVLRGPDFQHWEVFQFLFVGWKLLNNCVSKGLVYAGKMVHVQNKSRRNAHRRAVLICDQFIATKRYVYPKA